MPIEAPSYLRLCGKVEEYSSEAKKVPAVATFFGSKLISSKYSGGCTFGENTRCHEIKRCLLCFKCGEIHTTLRYKQEISKIL